MPDPATPLDRLQAHWVHGGALAGALLLLLTPLVAPAFDRPMLLVWLTLPAYMLHQLEEHDADRFRRFVNIHLAGGAEALTVRAVFIINIFGVWAVIAATLWLMRLAGPGWGLIAAYLVVVNALAHAGQALAMRRPNPGLWTGLALFLPLGAAVTATLAPLATLAQHAVALALVLALHVAIFAGVARARRKGPRP